MKRSLLAVLAVSVFAVVGSACEQRPAEEHPPTEEVAPAPTTPAPAPAPAPAETVPAAPTDTMHRDTARPM